MNARKSGTIPSGRLQELQAHPLADRIAYKVGRGIFDDYAWKVFRPRAFMLACVLVWNDGK